MSGGLLDDFKELTSSAIPSQKRGKRHDSHVLKAPSTSKGSPLKTLLNFGKKKSKEKKEKGKKDDLQIEDFEIPDGSTVDEESEEWQAFQQMLAKSKATVEQTKKNISKLEKTTSIGEGASIEVKKPTSTDWESFEEEEEEEPISAVSPPITSTDNALDLKFDDEPIVSTTTNLNSQLLDTSTELIDTSSSLTTLKVSPVPSPAHQPIPPHNSRRESIDVDTMEDDGIEELNLELQTVPCPAPDAADSDMPDFTADLLGLSSETNVASPPETRARSASVNEELLANLCLDALSPSSDAYDGMISGQSSGISSPVHMRMFEVQHVPGGSEFTNKLVDEFLGVSSEPPPPVSEQLDILGKIASLTASNKLDEPSKSVDPLDSLFGPVPSTNNNAANNTASELDDFLGFGVSSKISDGVDSSAKNSAINPFLLDNGGAAENPEENFADSMLDDFLGVPATAGPRSSSAEMMHDSSFEPESDKDTGDDDFFDPRAAGGHENDATILNGVADVWGGANTGEPVNGVTEFEVDFSKTDEVDASLSGFICSAENLTSDPFADSNQNVVSDIDVNDVFANSENDAFFTRVDEASANNPFLGGGTDAVIEENGAFSIKKNPFVDHVDALVESQQKPDFDAIFGEMEDMPNFDSVCALKAVGSSNEYDEPPESTTSLDVFDPFQTIHPASSEDNAGGFVSDEDADEPTRAIQAFKISDAAPQQEPKDGSPALVLPPPPKLDKGFLDTPPRFNPFDKPDSSSEDEDYPAFPEPSKEEEKPGPPPRPPAPQPVAPKKTPSEEEWIPEDLPVFHEPFEGEGWHLMLRQPTKKKLTSNRYWKKCWVKIFKKPDSMIIKCWDDEREKDLVQELTVQPCYSVSEEALQQYDQYGKIHTFKVQYIFYKERVGIRPDRITPQNISNLVRKPKPTMILDHAPQISELMKFGSLDQDYLHMFIHELEDHLMKMEAHRDKTLSYAKDEVSVEVWDEYKAELNGDGQVVWQKGRVRLFCLAFVTGMPACEIGINDIKRDGLEVVGRHDIIPLKTEDWIRIQDWEFHSTVDMAEFTKNNNIRFHPLDACQFELTRFRVPLRENKELPLQLRMKFVVTKGKEPKVDIRGDVMIPGYYSSEDGQVPCEDIQIRIPIPEQWIYFFRVERRFGYGSVHAAKRKPGKIKGLERITMMAQGFAPPSLIEVDVGNAKYEHVYRSIVWRIGRLPDRNHGAYKTHLFSCHLDLGAHDEVPETYEKYCRVQYTMPGATVSKVAVRSISCENPTPPEKWVRYIAKYDYLVEIDNVMKDDLEGQGEPEEEKQVIEQDYAI